MVTDALIHFKCYGGFAYRTDGDWRTGPSFKRGREFLEYMVVHPRAMAPPDTLADAFWPTLDADSARQRLHRAVAGGRAALRVLVPQVNPIRCISGSYTWAIAIESDHEELQRCYRSGDLEQMKRGVALYAGDFCAGEDADWMHAVRVQSLSTFESMLERLAEDAWQRSDYRETVEYALRLTDSDRSNEVATRLAMRAFSAMGRKTKALALYDALRRWLRLHNDVEPAPATRLLAKEIAEAE